jgi:acyl-coenzyme A thioesterase PaaI-like protein
VTIDLPGHENCFACRPESEGGLGLKFEPGPDGVMRARWIAGSDYQSYDGVLHGGIIALLLDAAMTHCLLAQGIQCLTGRLSVRYFERVPIGAELNIEAGVKEKRRGLHIVEALLKRDDRVAAKAEGRLMPYGG